MHIHSVSFAAIGPFAGEHRIDFDELGGSALFLIDGPTGAGKSTIIDAIVFALFGDVAGRSSDRQRLRSSFATPDQATFAEVDFSASAGRYRIRRTPEYERTKVRGTGTTTESPTVLLSRSTGPDGWEPLSRSKGEADAEVQRAIGLSSAQFLQTVVLPQGEFANFLAAESKDRLAVLERIFATDLYSRMEVALEEARRAALSRREDAERAVTSAIQHVRSRLSDDELEQHSASVPDGTDDEGVVSGFHALLEQTRVRLGEVGERVELSAKGLAEVDVRIAGARAMADASARLLASKRSSAEAMASRERAGDALGEFGRVLTSLGLDADDAGASMATVDRLVGSLGPLLVVEAAIPTRAGELADVEARDADLARRIAALTQERDTDLPERLLVLATALAAVVVAARADADDAARDESELLTARLEGMAAELAGALADGEPCPVCGAVEHPQPAQSSREPVSPADLAASAARRRGAEAAWHAFTVEQARLPSVAADRTAAEPAAHRDVAVPEISAEDVAEEVRLLQGRMTQIEAALSSGRVERAGLAAGADSLRAELDRDRKTVAEALAGSPSLEARVRELEALRAALEALDEASRRCDEAEADVVLATTAMSDLRDATGGSEALADLQATRLALENDLRSATSARDASTALLSDLSARIEAVEGAVAAHARARAATADTITLANVVRGAEGNSLAQPLSAYVVQTMFDEILDSANQRLRAMLDGRFELKATEQRTGRKTSGLGLGLEVRDLRTDSVRKTATLSGGETFCASLALALGLADTVRAHAGGVEIGMLFIDEGFGSLDGDRLDVVMAELLRLRADGRTVGVISHVSEMKKSILERIDVQPLPERRGSTLSVSWSP